VRRDARAITPPDLTVAQAVSELRAIIDSERAADPFLHWRDDCGRQLVLALRGARWRVTIGRSSASDVALTWDAKVSRTHALLERVAGGWTVVDDGLSRNGTFLNGSRLVGRQRLADGDRIDIGGSRLVYREPVGNDSASTAATDAEQLAPALSPTQRKVLIALCRPVNQSPAATPATNRQIAAEVCLSVDAVKSHLRVLCDRFGLSDLRQNEKRARLAQAALAAGLVAPRDF
jgi:predicted component of type VI protein secretion system